jgi:N-formylmaleamate deformylase
MVRTYQPHGERHAVAADGLALSVLRYPGPGPHAADLVLIPGITTTATGCDFLAVELAKDFAVVVPDLRGRGRSDRASAGRYTLDDYAGDLQAVIHQLGLADPVVIGHSLGARIVARWAAGRSDHGPLLLVDPPLSSKARPYPTPWSSFEGQLSEATAGTTVDDVRRYYPKWPQRELEVRIQELPTCDVTAIKETHAGFETDEFEADWSRLTPPVSLVYGAQMSPDANVLSVADAGHMVPWDNLAGFLATVADAVPRATDSQMSGGRHG